MYWLRDEKLMNSRGKKPSPTDSWCSASQMTMQPKDLFTPENRRENPTVIHETDR